MSVSVDGFIADRDGAFGWTAPSEGAVSSRRYTSWAAMCAAAGCTRRCWCGRRLRPLRDHRAPGRGRRLWCGVPKVVISRTLHSGQGNARLADASVAEEIAAALDATDKDVSIGGAGLAAPAIELGLVDELRMFR
jgi:hypothetical protein